METTYKLNGETRSAFSFSPRFRVLARNSTDKTVVSESGRFFLKNWQGGVEMDELEMRTQMELERLGELLEEALGLDIEALAESWEGGK